MAEEAHKGRGIEARTRPGELAARTAAALAAAARRSARPPGQVPLHMEVTRETAAAADDRRRSAGGRDPRHPSKAARAARPRGPSGGGLPHVAAHRSEGVRHGWHRSWLEKGNQQCQGGCRLPPCLGWKIRTTSPVSGTKTTATST